MNTERGGMAPMSAPSSLDRLLRSWKLSLTAGNKSQNTIEVYSSALEAFQTWLTENGHATEARKIEKQYRRLHRLTCSPAAASRRPPTTATARSTRSLAGWSTRACSGP